MKKSLLRLRVAWEAFRVSVVLDNRFWSKVSVGAPDECWEWQAGTNRDGYGGFKYPTGSHKDGSRKELAHVLAYCWDRGLALSDLPSDPSYSDGRRIAVSHLCDVPACVNPAHLVVFPDGNRGNTRDRDEKGRGRWGDGSHMKTIEGRERAFRVHELRALGWTQQRIAEEVGLANSSVVSQILSGRKWPEVKEAFEA